MTPLIAAAGLGHTAVVNQLLSAGARVDARDNLGTTALMAAAANHKLDVVKILLASVRT